MPSGERAFDLGRSSLDFIDTQRTITSKLFFASSKKNKANGDSRNIQFNLDPEL